MTDRKINNEDTDRPADKDTRTVRQFETDDGTPVEPSVLPPKYPVGEPDPDAMPGVHEVAVGEDAIDKPDAEKGDKA